jgi:Soluble lytic murein transglycosylase and related regulatory proteins (some contain LysM/invasin domains)
MDDDAPSNPPLPPSRGAASVPQRDRTSELSQSLCPLIQSVAAQNELPVEFFARLIWQESRLRPDAVGPVTRSGKRAQGIAQFMPATAAERFLLDAFDPAQALPKSAEFLRELRAKFGNLGLAAAAYNAGPQRVQDWLSGKRTLPSETLAYVRSVTGHSAEEWKRPDARTWQVSIASDTPCVGTTKLAAKPAPAAPSTPPAPRAAWAVQLIGDRLESTRFPDTRSSKRNIRRSSAAVSRSSCARPWAKRRSGIASASRRILATRPRRCARGCARWAAVASSRATERFTTAVWLSPIE